ncbi:MAG: type II toxin-antitoxin system death-on-curing family toxin [Steroidobacteraceae bacterium]
MQPTWVSQRAARHIHAELMAEHGGLVGPAREGALEAVLARPQQLLAYTSDAITLERLAAAYGIALVRGHCYPDGNKRLALAIMDVFLQLNGLELTASEPDAVLTLRAVAAGEMEEEDLVRWVQEYSAPAS